MHCYKYPKLKNPNIPVTKMKKGEFQSLQMELFLKVGKNWSKKRRSSLMG
jgi:hypothetical protein